MNKAIRVLSLLLCVVLLFGLVPTVSAAEMVAGGTSDYDKNWSWSLDDTGLLTVIGEGEMPEDFSIRFNYRYNYFSHDYVYASDGKWQSYAERISKVSLKGLITTVSKNAFYNCQNLKKVSFPDSITTIGDYAFSGCSSSGGSAPGAYPG